MTTVEPSIDELQRRVLQSTLQEVAQSQSRADADGHNAAECCVICLGAIEEPCVVQPCRHANFDLACILSWLYEQPSCPLCKATVTHVHHETEEGQQTIPIHEKAAESNKAATSSTRSTRPYSVDSLYVQANRSQSYHRLSSRRRHDHASRANSAPVSDPLLRRREVYRRLLYSKHVGSNRLSRYQELTPQLFVKDAELVSRARMFIRRELRVFSFLSSPETDDDDDSAGRDTESSTGPHRQHPTAISRRRASNAEFLLEYIIAILKSVDIMGSDGQAEDMLTDFLGRENTRLFLHELRAWLRSPYTKLEDWDRAVQYEEEPLRARGGQAHAPSAKRSAEEDGNTQNRGKQRASGGDFYRPNYGRRGPSQSGRNRLARHEPY